MQDDFLGIHSDQIYKGKSVLTKENAARLLLGHLKALRREKTDGGAQHLRFATECSKLYNDFQCHRACLLTLDKKINSINLDTSLLDLLHELCFHSAQRCLDLALIGGFDIISDTLLNSKFDTLLQAAGLRLYKVMMEHQALNQKQQEHALAHTTSILEYRGDCLVLYKLSLQIFAAATINLSQHVDRMTQMVVQASVHHTEVHPGDWFLASGGPALHAKLMQHIWEHQEVNSACECSLLRMLAGSVEPAVLACEEVPQDDQPPRRVPQNGRKKTRGGRGRSHHH